MSKEPEVLMKSVYPERLSPMAPQLLRRFEQKEKKLAEAVEVQRDIIYNLECCTAIATQ